MLLHESPLLKPIRDEDFEVFGTGVTRMQDNTRDEAGLAPIERKVEDRLQRPIRLLVIPEDVLHDIVRLVDRVPF